MSILDTLKFIAAHPLSKGQKFENLLRFCFWQIGSRLVPGDVVVDFVNDAKLFVRVGMKGATMNVYVGLQEFEDMAFVLHFLRRGDVFADIGANVGSYTVLGAVTKASVIACEPSSNSFAWLQKNVAINDISDVVETHNIALGARCGSARITVDLDSMNYVVVENSDAALSASELVPMQTLDALLCGRCPSLMKVDVEGFEMEVLRGAESTLANQELLCVIIEMNGDGNRYGFDDNEIVTSLRNYGFECYSYVPLERRLHKGVLPRCSRNMLFVRNPTQVEKRLLEGPAFIVRGHKI